MTSVCRFSLLAVTLAGAALVQADTGLAREGAASWLDNLSVTAAGTASWVENASRTSFQPTRKNAMTYDFDVAVGQHRQLAPSWLLNASMEADLLDEPEFERAGNLTVGPRLGLQRKFGLGPMAPVLSVDAAYTYKAARLEADRGWTADASVRLSQRINSSLKVAASGQWLEHYANSSTFDIQQRTVSLEAAWDINERWRLSGSASRLEGRIVANAAPQIWAQAISGGLGSAVYNYYTTIPSEMTGIYGPGWVSYNVAAHAQMWSAALDYALSEQTTIGLRTGSVYVVNKINIRYPTDSWGLSLAHRF